MVMCWVPDCKHYYEKNNCKFYRFPKDKNLAEKWVVLVRRSDATPTEHSKICSCHFLNQKKENLPTIYKNRENQAELMIHAPQQVDKKNLPCNTLKYVQTKMPAGQNINRDLPIEQVDVGSTSCEETTDPDLDFLPESGDPSLPKHKRPKDMKTYCRLCLNPATKNHMVCLGDFHDINYPSRTELFKRTKILQTERYLRMIRTLMPNFSHDLVYNPIMCNDCTTRLQMASDFVEQCMATQNLIQQYKDTFCPAEKLVSCEDVVHNKSHLLAATNQAVPSNPKKLKIAKPVPQQPTETVSYNEDFQTLENVNVKTEQFEEMENELKYEITPEEDYTIKQEFVEEETVIKTEESEITLPVDTVVKNEQTSIKQFSNIDIPTTEVDSIYNENYLVGIPAQFCPPTLPARYCPPIQPVASETFVSLINPVTTQSTASNNVNLSLNFQNNQNR